MTKNTRTVVPTILIAFLLSLMVTALATGSVTSDNDAGSKKKEKIPIADKDQVEAGTSLALKGAKGIEKILEKAMDEKLITFDDLFDENYLLISPSPPLKFRTRFDSFLDKSIQSFEDSILTSDLRVEFAIVVDRNGYLPTHNSKFSKPLTGDFDTDLANNRGKRFFNDPVGIAAARNQEEMLIQSYRRDNKQKMYDFSVPIFVKGKHWGAFRVGMKRE